MTDVQITKDKVGKTQNKPYVQWRWKTSWSGTTGDRVPLAQVHTLDMIRRLTVGDPKKSGVPRNPARVHVQDTSGNVYRICSDKLYDQSDDGKFSEGLPQVWRIAEEYGEKIAGDTAAQQESAPPLTQNPSEGGAPIETPQGVATDGDPNASELDSVTLTDAKNNVRKWVTTGVILHIHTVVHNMLHGGCSITGRGPSLRHAMSMSPRNSLNTFVRCGHEDTWRK